MDEFVTLSQKEYQTLAVHSALVERARLASSAGTTFNGKRDLYEAVGYKRVLEFRDYLAKYERQDIATRIIQFPAQESWRKPPKVRDGEGDEATDDTDFVKAWEALTGRLRVWHHFQRLDILTGIGRFGLLLIGARDGGQELSQPLMAGSLKEEKDIIFLSPFSEKSVEITKFVTDMTNPRYGLPEMYKLDVSVEEGKQLKREVHWTRVLHVAEELTENDVYGTPRLQAVYNQLDNLEKIVAAAAEAAWNVADRGMKINIDPAASIGDDVWNKLETQLEEYRHRLRKTFLIDGGDVAALGSDTVDPSPTFETCVALIAGKTGIPQRILLGSERGELASTQDASSWAAVIDARQQNFAAPVILRPFIDRLIECGALPKPSANSYSIGELGDDDMYHWPAIFELTDEEKATVREKKANAFKRYREAGVDVVPAALRSGHTRQEAEEMAVGAMPMSVPATPAVNGG